MAVADLRLAVRALRATPAVSAVAILSLALGIGANTAIFSIVNSLMLRPLPVRDPGRLALVVHADGRTFPAWTYPVWQELRARPQLFEGAVAWSPVRFTLGTGIETDFADGLFATGSFFEVLGVPAVAGRMFSEADDRRGGGPDGPVAVISHRFWERRFGGAADVVGRTLPLDGVRFTIIGVTPSDFFGLDLGRSFDVAIPLESEPLVHPSTSWLDARSFGGQLKVMARLKQRQSIEEAAEALRGLSPQIMEATQPPNWPKDYLARYLKEAITLERAAMGNGVQSRDYRRPVLTIMVVVALVLLIACANIANLLLARSVARRREFSVRLALGASRWRLARQLLVESAVMAGTGAAIGLLLASWGSRLLIGELSNESNPVFLDVSTDGRVLLFTIAITVLTTLLFGMMPAFRGSSVRPMEALDAYGRSAWGEALGGPKSVGLASGLVVAQVALSVVLVVAAGLFVRTFVSLTARPLGFDRDLLLLASIDADKAAPDLAGRVQLLDRVRDAVGVLPGVAGVGFSRVPPVAGGLQMGQPIDAISGVPVPVDRRFSALQLISPGVLGTLGTGILTGRDFSDRDRRGAPPVALVNQAFRRRFFDERDPLGQTISITLPTPAPPFEIVGVVADAVSGSLRSEIQPTMYLPIAQLGDVFAGFLLSMNLSVRSAGEPPAQLTRRVAAAIAAVNPNLAFKVNPLTQQIAASLARERATALVSGFFGVLALLLAGLGLYGVTTYAIVRRRAEIGIRLALGAEPSSVVRLMLSRVAVLVGTGTVAGVAVSLWLSRLVAPLLYGLQPGDPATLLEAALIMAAVAAVAGWLPANRAARIDPAQVLREG